MARGWESKAVESQIEEAAQTDDRGGPLNSEQAELRKKREGLLLTRTRLLHELNAARHPRHRMILQEALEHIERELARQ